MQTHHWPAQQRVHFGTGALKDSLSAELEKLGWKHVMLVMSHSLRGGELAQLVANLIGARLSATYSGIPAHTPLDSVTSLVESCQHEAIDGIVALGGGSVIDACKVALLALGEHIPASELTVSRLIDASNAETSDWALEPRPRMLAIPTTLSAAEFTSFGGFTDASSHTKIVAAHPSLVPVVVILDHLCTLSTPMRLLLSTGARSIDHSIEGFCSISATPMSDATSIEAGRLMLSALPRLHGNSDDQGAHRDAQTASWLSVIGRSSVGVAHGASHGLGYILGTSFGVPHGETSCVMLPAVLRWNATTNGERQREFSRRVGINPDIALADHIDTLFTSMGLPTRLSQVGIYRDQFERLAGLYDGTGPISTNPKPIRGARDLIAILEFAA